MTREKQQQESDDDGPMRSTSPPMPPSVLLDGEDGEQLGALLDDLLNAMGDDVGSTADEDAPSTTQESIDASWEATTEHATSGFAADTLVRSSSAPSDCAEQRGSVGGMQGEAIRQKLSSLKVRTQEMTEKTKEKVRNARLKLQALRDRAKHRMTAVRRKVITGDAEKRVRDYMREVPVVKTMDKVLFTFGVGVLTLIQYIVFVYPQYFGHLYCVLMMPLLVIRYFAFKKEKWQYFLIDLCYFVSIASMLSFFYPQLLGGKLLLIAYVLGNGPVAAGNLAWRDSFVFHNLQKVTTALLHGLPIMLSYTWRWLPGTDRMYNALCGEDTFRSECPVSAIEYFVYPSLFYISWQALYLFYTEFIMRKELDADEDLKTSLRWITKSKGGVASLYRNACVSLHLMRPDEDFDYRTTKTKLIFVTGQLLYTIVTMLPTYLMFRFQVVHMLFVFFIWTSCVWNGAGYYINVFSVRYVEKIDKLKAEEEEHRALVHATAGKTQQTFAKKRK